MKSKLLLMVVALLLVGHLFPLMAQEYIDEDGALLFAKTYCLFERKEPKWQLEGHGVLSNSFALYLISRKGRASVLAHIFSSEAEAKDTMKYRLELMDREPEKDVFPPPTRYSKIALKNYGEESYLITNTKYRSTRIMFRRGRYLIDVSGQTEDIARRFARHIYDLLPPSNNSFNPSPR